MCEGFWYEKPKESNYLRNLGVYGSVIYSISEIGWEVVSLIYLAQVRYQ